MEIFDTKVNGKKIVITSVITVFLIIALCCIGSLVEDVKNEQIVVNQVPFTGTVEVWATPGLHFQAFGNTTHYYKTQQLWFGADDNGEPIAVKFNDMSDGEIYGSLRIKLPTDYEHMKLLYTEYKGMDRLMQGRTVFVIAHRLSTVQNSDVIMVLDHGRIIERGSHKKLIEEKGTYYRLYTGAFEME